MTHKTHRTQNIHRQNTYTIDTDIYVTQDTEIKWKEQAGLTNTERTYIGQISDILYSVLKVRILFTQLNVTDLEIRVYLFLYIFEQLQSMRYCKNAIQIY